VSNKKDFVCPRRKKNPRSGKGRGCGWKEKSNPGIRSEKGSRTLKEGREAAALLGGKKVWRREGTELLFRKGNDIISSRLRGGGPVFAQQGD